MVVCKIAGIRARESGRHPLAERERIFRQPRRPAPCTRAGIRMAEGLRAGNHLRPAPAEGSIDTSPLRGAVHTLPPITVAVASHSPAEALWDQLVRGYHYLGYQKLLGHRLKYLAFLEGRPVAALSFSAPARTLRVRDRWIGWSAAQRKAHLARVVNNSRFLLPPWVAVQNLASHVLARALARLPGEWAARFGDSLGSDCHHTAGCGYVFRGGGG